MKLSMPSFGNLEGVKVLSTASAAAGPFTVCLFAENGAEIVFVENPVVPDVVRTWPYAWANERRNMKNLSLEITSQEGRPIFEKLIGWADIFIESAKGGTYKKWGWSDEALWKINPKLVIVHISGFGQEGVPEFVSRASYDFIGQSFGGIVLHNGLPEPNPPMYLRPYLCDYTTGMMGAWSALAGYINAQKTGKGESIDIAQYEVMLRLQWWYPMAGFNDGKEAVRVADMDPTIAGDAFYRTKDDKYMTISMIGIGPLSRGLKIIGLGDDKDFEGVQIVMKANEKIAGKFVQGIRDFCAAHTAEEVDKIFNDAQVPCTPAMTYADMMAHPHYQARNDIIEMYSPLHDKKIKVTAPVPKFKNKPQQIFQGGAKLGQDNEEVLKNIVGLSDEAIKELYDKKTVAKK